MLSAMMTISNYTSICSLDIQPAFSIYACRTVSMVDMNLLIDVTRSISQDQLPVYHHIIFLMKP